MRDRGIPLAPFRHLPIFPKQALEFRRLYEPTDGNNPSKPHKIGPFFLM